MGISDLSRYDTLVNGIMTQQTQLQQLLVEQGTGTTLQQPSDDPVGTGQLLGINLDMASITAFQKNAAIVQTNMNSEDSTETALGQLLSSAKSIAESLSPAPPGDPSRATAIAQLNQLLQQIVNLANTQVGDTYIFGGFKSSAPPMQATAGNAPAVLGTSMAQTEATASAGATTSAGVYQLTSDGAGNVTLTNESNPSQTETVSGVTNATPSINFAALGITVTSGSGFTVAGLNGQTIGVATGYAYQGDSNRPEVAVDTGVTLETNHTGDKVFANAIAALQDTIAALSNGTSTAVSTAAAQISQAQTQVLAVQSDGGVTLQQLQLAAQAQTARQSSLELQQSNLDAITPDQVAAQLLSVQNALQLAYAATGRVASLSLANYLPATAG